MKLKNAFAYLLISSCLILSDGCIWWNKPVPPTPSPEPPRIEMKVQENVEHIDKLKETIEDKATDIKNNSVSIQENVKDANSINKVKEVGVKLDAIDTKAKVIEKTSVAIIENTKEMKVPISELAKLQVQLDALQKYISEYTEKSNETIKELSKTNAVYVKDIEKLKSDANAKAQKILMIVLSICCVMLIGGVLLSVYGQPKVGIPLAIGAIGCFSIAYFMAAYTWLIGIVGGVFILGIIVYSISYIYTHKKSLIESMISFETVKSELKKVVDSKTWENVKDTVNNIQSPTTQKIIKNLKFDERIGK